jgi:hypothetical protein
VIQYAGEEYHPSVRASARTEFIFLGLTDCVLADLAERFLILSNDVRMVVKLNEAGLDALNFNHYRDQLQMIANRQQ